MNMLERNDLVEIWYDSEILAGENLDDEINENLEDADIVCLFMSSNYISSDYCMKEKNRALELKIEKGISVINIILSPCPWKDDETISYLKALPRDGKCIYSEKNQVDLKWNEVYEGLKRLVEKINKIKQLKITDEHENFLNNTEMLEQAHSHKSEVILDDIFIYPELVKFDLIAKVNKRISSKEIIQNILDYPNLVLAGESRSGKTSICKMFFKQLFSNNFVPVYLEDKKDRFKKDIEKLIVKSFKNQYECLNIDDIDKKRIVPIIDDFHEAKNKERHIKELNKNYNRFIIVIDDISNINVKDETLVGSFERYQIRECSPSLRYELINKWDRLTDEDTNNYKNIDEHTTLINNFLGKTFGSGIMPAYPFFILSAIVTCDTFGLHKDITSQGYCYQALIYFYLKREGVEDNDIDTYMNFLTEFAYHLYTEKKCTLTVNEFNSFFENYSKKFILKIEKDELIRSLSLIILVNNLNNYSFRYNYNYFFFVAKYLADNITDNVVENEIDDILKNLHLEKNAYILVFLSHHSRNPLLLNKLVSIVESLFEGYEPATLTKEEVKFFDDQIDNLIKAVLNPHSTAEGERERRLKKQDEIEEFNNSEKREDDFDDADFVDLRRAMKTSEVIGSIIKDRYGSLTKENLEIVIKETIDLNLRILNYYFEITKKENGETIEVLSEIIKKNFIENSDKLPDDEEIKKMAQFIFWNLSFIIVNGILYKIIHSLGSDNLSDVINKVCDDINTPASFIIKHGILMWYSKNLIPNELSKGLKQKDISVIAIRVIGFLVANFCSLHHLNHGELINISNELRIPMKELVSRNPKKEI